MLAWLQRQQSCLYHFVSIKITHVVPTQKPQSLAASHVTGMVLVKTFLDTGKWRECGNSKSMIKPFLSFHLKQTANSYSNVSGLTMQSVQTWKIYLRSYLKSPFLFVLFISRAGQHRTGSHVFTCHNHKASLFHYTVQWTVDCHNKQEQWKTSEMHTKSF